MNSQHPETGNYAGKRSKDEPVEITKCSEPGQDIKQLYELLKYKSYPFTKRKSVVHKPEIKKSEKQENHLVMDDLLQSGLTNSLKIQVRTTKILCNPLTKLIGITL